MSFFGAVLYSKRIMGSRSVVEGEVKEVCGFKFRNYGSSIDTYPSLPDFTVAAAIGMGKGEMQRFLEKLDENFKEFYEKYGGEMIKGVDEKEKEEEKQIE